MFLVSSRTVPVVMHNFFLGLNELAAFAELQKTNLLQHRVGNRCSATFKLELFATTVEKCFILDVAWFTDPSLTIHDC